MTQACAHDIDDTFTHCFDQVEQMIRRYFWRSRSLQFQPLCIASKKILVALPFVNITKILMLKTAGRKLQLMVIN